MYEFNLTLPVVPKSLNKELRTNRWRRNSANKRWDILIKSECRNCIPAVPLKKAKIKLIRHFYRTLDYDGLVGSMKPVVDALVSAGILKDDSWKTLGVWNVTQEFRPKKDGPLLQIHLIEDNT